MVVIINRRLVGGIIMKKKPIWISIVLISAGFIICFMLFSYLGFAKKESSKPNIPGANYFFETYKEDDLQISNIRLFLSSDDVLKILGNPQEKKRVTVPSINNLNYITYKEIWIYPGIATQFLTSVKKGNSIPEKPDRVLGIIVTGLNYMTKRGIKVGDSLNRVFEKYGRIEPTNNSYQYQMDLVYIKFVISNEKVTQIEIGGEMD